MHQNAAFAVQAIRAGARGYVTKTSPPETLVQAVMDVLADGSPSVRTSTMSSRSAALPARPVAADVLTAREFEVLRMLLAERTTEQIADTLHISPEDRGQSALPHQRTSLASARISNLSG